MDFMRKIPERYRGIAYFLLGGFFLFLALRLSSGGAASAEQVASTPNESSTKIPIFIIGMAIPSILFFTLKRKPTLADEKTKPRASSGDYYKGLVAQASDTRSFVNRNNRLYLGSLIVTMGAKTFGAISEHPILGHPLVIAFVYMLGFFACIQQLVRGKKLEERIFAYSIEGIQFEKRARKSGYFHEIMKGPQGLEKFTLIFFRMVTPLWLLYCAFDFVRMGTPKELFFWFGIV